MAISNTSAIQNQYATYENINKVSKEHSENSSVSNNRINDIKDSYETSEQTSVSEKKKTFYGNTIGNVKLSDNAAKYYEELKKKYSNLNFVLVSAAEKDNALGKAAKYNNGYQITTVIDEEKIERMASDPEYRKQMEEYIDNAVEQMNALQNKLDEEGLGELVGGLGVQVNDDGTISYFAVLKDMAQAQKERIEDHLEKTREEKKEERNKEKLKAYENQMKNKPLSGSEKDKEMKTDASSEYGQGIWNSSSSKVLKSSSIDDLFEQIKASFVAK